MKDIIVRVNCKNNDQGAWCKDKRIKRSLFGIGARICPVYNGGYCEFQDKFKRPKIEPALQNTRI